MFRWANLSSHTAWLMSLRTVVPQNIPDWIIYALPDGLWACSYTILIGTIWDFNVEKCLAIMAIIPLMGILSELLQCCNVLPGVFDWHDLVAYSLGFVIGIAYINRIRKIRINKEI